MTSSIRSGPAASGDLGDCCRRAAGSACERVSDDGAQNGRCELFEPAVPTFGISAALQGDFRVLARTGGPRSHRTHHGSVRFHADDAVLAKGTYSHETTGSSAVRQSWSRISVSTPPRSSKASPGNPSPTSYVGRSASNSSAYSSTCTGWSCTTRWTRITCAVRRDVDGRADVGGNRRWAVSAEQVPCRLV
ncbi:hypothetical protein C8039_14155 [Halogeometricum sp. wsp3]|nr:hypothetical protein C8039_14155 [Halogeometricum sp. wsp3]